MNTLLAICKFKERNPNLLIRALIVKRLGVEQIFLWSKESNILTVKKWKDLYLDNYSVRVVNDTDSDWDRVWKVSKPMMRGIKKCRIE